MNSDKKRYFILKEDCIFEKGPINGVIFNLESGKNFFVDKEAADILSFSERGHDFIKISKLLGITKNNLNAFFDALIRFGLGDFYPQRIFIDNFKYFEGKNVFLERAHSEISLMSLAIEISDKYLLNYKLCEKNESIYSFCGFSVLKDQKRTNIAKIKEAIKEGAGFGLKSVLFGGGDPLLCEEKLKDLLDYCARLGIKKFIIRSNCIFINRSIPHSAYLGRAKKDLSSRLSL